VFENEEEEEPWVGGRTDGKGLHNVLVHVIFEQIHVIILPILHGASNAK
jgi:hypothetical protein